MLQGCLDTAHANAKPYNLKAAAAKQESFSKPLEAKLEANTSAIILPRGTSSAQVLSEELTAFINVIVLITFGAMGAT